MLNPPAGDYIFTCKASNGQVLLWLDDHLLCGSPALFAPGVAGDAPLPPFVRLKAAGPGYYLRAQFFHNETSALPAVLQLWCAGL